jgi:hypothetical protein
MRIRPLIGGLGCLLFAVPVVVTWTHGAIPAIVQWLSVAILGITLIRPAWGLLATAFLVPLSPYLWARTLPGVSPLAIAEILLAPFLLAAGVRFAAGLHAPASRLARPALVLGTIVACSGIIGLAARQQVTNWPLEYLLDFGRHLRSTYFNESPEFAPYHMAVLWIEGLTLAVFAERLLRVNQRAWPAVLIAGGTAAAATAWIRLAEIAGRSGMDAAITLALFVDTRVNTLFTDVNATGSLFALYLVPAIWLTWMALRPTEERRRWTAVAGYGVSSIVLALAIWLTASRVAHASVIVGLAVVWLTSLRWSWKTIALGLGGAALVVTAAVVLNPGSASQSSPSTSAITRWEMARVALKITDQHPMFGVGLAEFRRESRAFISTELMKIFPATGSGENAHNNFLQILAELGVVGLAGFLWLVVAGARSIPSTADPSRAAVTSRALAGGVLAFLVSALGGHPFLTIPVLWTFCLMLGAVAGLGVPLPSSSAPMWARRIAIAAVCLLVISIPVRFWLLRYTDRGFNYIGADRLMKDISGVAHHRAEPRSLWWIPADWKLVEVPLRVTGDSALPCLAHVKVDGKPANIIAVGPTWTRATMQLSPPGDGRPSRRVELQVDRADCSLLVGEFSTR